VQVWRESHSAHKEAPTDDRASLLPNALGGIRLAEHAVPTATNTGLNTGPGFCFLFGSHEPFDEATLAALYRNHGKYVSAVDKVTSQNLAAGFFLAPEAEATIEEAAHSNIGKRTR